MAPKNPNRTVRQPKPTGSLQSLLDGNGGADVKKPAEPKQLHSEIVSSKMTQLFELLYMFEHAQRQLRTRLGPVLVPETPTDTTLVEGGGKVVDPRIDQQLDDLIELVERIRAVNGDVLYRLMLPEEIPAHHGVVAR